ncbi:hypothetical protein JXM67_14535 [candidate division WOR-3 bacterium]|nr:hypothetical protein [candidate division WOR-3 bacterium]
MGNQTAIKPFEITFDSESEVLHVDILRLETEAEVHAMWAEIKSTYEGKKLRNTLVNLSKSKQKKMSGAARKAFREYEDYLNTLDWTAFVISNPVVRMLVKATIAGLKREEGNISFFKTEPEALDWLANKIPGRVEGI